MTAAERLRDMVVTRTNGAAYREAMRELLDAALTAERKAVFKAIGNLVGPDASAFIYGRGEEPEGDVYLASPIFEQLVNAEIARDVEG